MLKILEHFDATFEEYKAIYPDGTSDYVTEVDFDVAQVILL